MSRRLLTAARYHADAIGKIQVALGFQCGRCEPVLPRPVRGFSGPIRSRLNPSGRTESSNLIGGCVWALLQYQMSSDALPDAGTAFRRALRQKSGYRAALTAAQVFGLEEC